MAVQAQRTQDGSSQWIYNQLENTCTTFFLEDVTLMETIEKGNRAMSEVTRDRIVLTWQMDRANYSARWHITLQGDQILDVSGREVPAPVTQAIEAAQADRESDAFSRLRLSQIANRNEPRYLLTMGVKDPEDGSKFWESTISNQDR